MGALLVNNLWSGCVDILINVLAEIFENVISDFLTAIMIVILCDGCVFSFKFRLQ